jgi:DNA invertase Pin-like site-specific DNA recombinase
MFRLITGEKVKRAYIEKKKIAGENKVKWGRPEVDIDRNAIIKDWNENEGVGYRQFAKKYGVSHQTIKRIIRGADLRGELIKRPCNSGGFPKSLHVRNKIPV